MIGAVSFVVLRGAYGEHFLALGEQDRGLRAEVDWGDLRDQSEGQDKRERSHRSRKGSLHMGLVHLRFAGRTVPAKQIVMRIRELLEVIHA
jgi:hypothetical protein